MKIEALTRAGALYVAQRMRADDAREIHAARWNEDAGELADDCMACAPLAWMATHGAPVAVFGASQHRPGVVGAWMFATDDFRAVAISVTRFMKRVMFPALVQSGVHRIQAESIDSHTATHRWLERCFGAQLEAVHPGFGRRAETFYTFAWTAKNVLPKSQA